VNDALGRRLGAQAGGNRKAADKDHDQETTHGLAPFAWMIGTPHDTKIILLPTRLH
jgi:hypothetical protein